MTNNADILSIHDMVNKLSTEMIEMAIEILESELRIRNKAKKKQRLENGETLAEVYAPDSYQAKIDRDNREEKETTDELKRDEQEYEARAEAKELSSDEI